MYSLILFTLLAIFFFWLKDKLNGFLNILAWIAFIACGILSLINIADFLTGLF